MSTGAWRYDINYGPDGEQNWANLVAPGGEHVANIRTHHAVAITEGMNRTSVHSLNWRLLSAGEPVAVTCLARFFDNELGEWVFTVFDPGPLRMTMAGPYTHWLPLSELLP